VLLADVSELSFGSIFIGRWMKNGWVWGVWCIYVSGGGCRRAVAEPMGRGVAGRGGWMHNRLWRGDTYIHHTPQTQPFFIRLPMKMEPIESSETSANNTQMPGTYPKESKLHKRISVSFEICDCLSFSKHVTLFEVQTWHLP
jgi:hypothetical protein